MSKLLLHFFQSPLFEVFAIWAVTTLITVAFRPGSELEAWTKQKGPRWFSALQMLRRLTTDLPEFATWFATFLWKRSPAEAQAELAGRIRVISLLPPPPRPPLAQNLPLREPEMPLVPPVPPSTPIPRVDAP